MAPRALSLRVEVGGRSAPSSRTFHCDDTGRRVWFATWILYDPQVEAGLQWDQQEDAPTYTLIELVR